MKSRNKRRNQRLFGLAIVLLAVVAICLLPALLAAVFVFPKVAGGLSLASMALLAGLGSLDGGDGGGITTALEKTGAALESLDNRMKTQNADIATLKAVTNDQKLKMDGLQRQRLVASAGTGSGQRTRGTVSEECARALAAHVILHVERCGKLDVFIRDASARTHLIEEARSLCGVNRAMSTAEIPLPTVYGSELLELIAQFGVIRGVMTPYPMTGGIAKPPRMGTRPTFGSITMSELVPEKKPTLTFASLESHKLGGVVIIPTEIDEASSVAMGRYLAVYGAVEFARAEDTWGFLADGTATYENVKGVCQIASENGRAAQLAAGKTKPSDATLEDFRYLRRLVSTGALSGGRYFLHQTFESRLRAFNTPGDPNAFIYSPDGSARLDGFPITWTEVLEPFGTAAAPSKNLAVFGNLRFWWFGQRGGPRVDTSKEAYFLYDMVATRFLEELDFDYASLEAAATLQTPAV